LNNKKINAGITVFPGSNCDLDVFYVLKNVFNLNVSFIWHKDSLTDYKRFDLIVIPGGFSYGDYLRAGALAARSRIMDSLKEYAYASGIILGICNGFQILLEAGLLSGAMLSNSSLRFECKDVYLRVLNDNSPFTCTIKAGSVLKMPIAHHDGNFFAEKGTIDNLKKTGRIIFQYCDENGNITAKANPNGSIDNIAGISNERFNVMGLMPHPERSSEKILGSEDGAKIFNSIITYLKNK
jgi:phosphoribosylformylglycinamidine synthase